MIEKIKEINTRIKKNCTKNNSASKTCTNSALQGLLIGNSTKRQTKECN